MSKANTTQDYATLWAKVLKAADACNHAPWYEKVDALKRYRKACAAAQAARKSQ